MTRIRIFQDLLLLRQAVDDYLSLPDNCSIEERELTINYVCAFFHCLQINMKLHTRALTDSHDSHDLQRGLPTLPILPNLPNLPPKRPVQREMPALKVEKKESA